MPGRRNRLLVGVAVAIVAVLGIAFLKQDNQSTPGRGLTAKTANSSAASSMAATPIDSESGTAPRTLTVPAEQAAAEIERVFGISVPPESCLASPNGAGCPAVTEVVITLPTTEGSGPTEYVPLAVTPDSAPSTPEDTILASVRPADTRLAAHGTGAACGLLASNPAVFYTAQANHTHHCLNGQGISEMEMWGDLQRWNNTDNRWYTLDQCYRGPYFGATTQQCSTFFNCTHPNSFRHYRGATSGYAVQNGRSFFGTDYSGTVTKKCYK